MKEQGQQSEILCKISILVKGNVVFCKGMLKILVKMYFNLNIKEFEKHNVRFMFQYCYSKTYLSHCRIKRWEIGTQIIFIKVKPFYSIS